jgi:hypothetical protein
VVSLLTTHLSMKSAVLALTPSAVQAEAVVDELRVSVFSNNDVFVLFPDVEGMREFAQTNQVARRIFERANAHGIGVTTEAEVPA